MASEVHAVVQNAQDKDRVAVLLTVKREMSSFQAKSAQVQRAHAIADLVSPASAGQMRTLAKSAEERLQRLRVRARLARAKGPRRPLNDARKISFGLAAEDDGPRRPFNQDRRP